MHDRVTVVPTPREETHHQQRAAVSHPLASCPFTLVKGCGLMGSCRARQETLAASLRAQWVGRLGTRPELCRGTFLGPRTRSFSKPGSRAGHRKSGYDKTIGHLEERHNQLPKGDMRNVRLTCDLGVGRDGHGPLWGFHTTLSGFLFSEAGLCHYVTYEEF